MIYIDKYAYLSALKDTKAELKLLFGISALVAAICSMRLASYGMVFSVMFFITVFKAKIPILYYIKLMLLPLGFLIFSVIGIIINVSREPFLDSCWGMSLGAFYIFIPKEGLDIFLHLVCKSLSAVSCLYFIILTTPMRDIISILYFIKCPRVMVNLIALIYRFIFLIMEVAVTKVKSQQCRHGYEHLRGFIKTFAMLWGSVFMQSYISAEWIYKAMQVRGHEGNIKFLTKKVHMTIKDITLIFIFVLIVVGLNFL